MSRTLRHRNKDNTTNEFLDMIIRKDEERGYWDKFFYRKKTYRRIQNGKIDYGKTPKSIKRHNASNYLKANHSITCDMEYWEEFDLFFSPYDFDDIYW